MRLFLPVTVLCLLFMLFTNSCDVVEKLANRDPVIKSISADPDTVAVNGTIFLTVEATDPDNDEMTYKWESSSGYFPSSNGATVQWVAPNREGVFKLEVTVTDVNKGKAKEAIKVAVVSESVPIVRITNPNDGEFFPGQGIIQVNADVRPVSFIDRVELYIEDVLSATKRHLPYNFDVDLTGRSGPMRIKVVATRIGSESNQGFDEIEINVEAVVPIPTFGAAENIDY